MQGGRASREFRVSRCLCGRVALPLSIVCGAVPFGVFPSEYPEFMLSCTAGPELRAIESARTFRRSPLLRVCGSRYIRITAHRDADRRPGCKKGLGPLISIRKRMPEMRGGGSLSSMWRGAWPPAVWNGDCRCREVLTAGISIYIISPGCSRRPGRRLQIRPYPESPPLQRGRCRYPVKPALRKSGRSVIIEEPYNKYLYGAIPSDFAVRQRESVRRDGFLDGAGVRSARSGTVRGLSCAILPERCGG